MGVKALQDKILLERIAKDDEKAFREIFERYKDRFYAAALKMTRSRDMAEEVVQEVFLALWLNRNTLADVEAPESYLFSIVYHTLSRHFKRRASERLMKVEMRKRMEKYENYTEEVVVEKESRLLLQNLIKQLPSQQQMIYKLSRIEGRSRKEIAEELHISPNTVKNHLLKAMKFIRTRWGEALMIIVWWWF